MIQFSTLLNAIKYQINNEIKDAVIKNSQFDFKEMKMRLVIEFPYVISPNALIDLNYGILNGIVKVGAAKEVEVTYEFVNQKVSNELLKDYYETVLSEVINSQIRYKALRKFNYKCDNNKVLLYLGDESEFRFVKPLLDNLQKSFNTLGLTFINLDVEISNFVPTIIDEIAVSREVSINESISKQNMYEAVVKNNEKQEKDKDKIYKPKKQSAPINGPVTKICDIPVSEYAITEYIQKNGGSQFVVCGDILKSEIVEKPTFKIFEGIINDGTDSIIIKSFIHQNNPTYGKFIEENCKVGYKIRVYGTASYDKYSRDVTIMFRDIIRIGNRQEKEYIDNEDVKRVELHAHSKMSTLESVLEIEQYLKKAVSFGHTALAITDKNTVQGLPILEKLIKKNKYDIKPIYGLEGSLVDEETFNIALYPSKNDIDLRDATFVVYDLETTGISSNYSEIIEIGACKVRGGEIIDEFSTYVNPLKPISEFTTSLTSITNDDVRNAPTIKEVLPEFKKFFDGCILVAHNATFDNSHIYSNMRRLGIYDDKIPTIDTLQLARVRYNHKLKKFGLEEVCKAFGVDLSQHHRAVHDAQATTKFFIKMLSDLLNDGIYYHNRINDIIDEEEAYKYAHPGHITMLAKNRDGLVNINRIITESYTVNYHRGPRILKKFLDTHRDGLLIGSSCYNGILFDKALNDSYDDLLEEVEFYDYLEVQPIDAYSHLVEKSGADLTIDNIKDVVKKIIDAGKAKNKIVVATGDVHELDEEDSVYRKMLLDKPMIGGGFHELHGLENMPKQYFRSTYDMLKQFDFLDYGLAYEIVVTNTNKIADMIERFPIFPKDLLAPGDDFMAHMGVPSAKEDLIRLTYGNAKAIYGDPLPQIISDRLDKELKSIIGNNYGSIYYIAYLLVKHSRDDGYVVGSRGSVGSSLVATFMGITEVNSLTPHYVCPKCHFSAFKYSKEEKAKYGQSENELKFEEILQNTGCGIDLPVNRCPVCGEILVGNGCDIPFETFLGFDGDKTPDIDLNFSGEYQARAHEFCREIFGKENAFRAGTIGKIAENTAFGYVKGYFESKLKQVRSCEIDRLLPNLVGVKRTTGQHPGGIVVIPRGRDINEVTPIQYPADDVSKDWRTTHHEYHNFEENLLKLDILGHDDPTMIRHLMNFVDENPSDFPFDTVEGIPLSDPDVLSLFSSVEALGVTSDKLKNEIGTTGLPEFGTSIAKDMLTEIRPKTVYDLIKISGLSHGTDVWAGNARDFFLGLRKGYEKVEFSKLIGCRDDIMVNLMAKGVPASNAFKIMESVRKGRGVSLEMEEIMKKHNVEDWFIECCKAIKYLFPKAHAAAYVLMALRIGWFKIHRPLCYYAGFFSKRADAWDVEVMAKGYDAIYQKVEELQGMRNLNVKDSKTLNCLQIALEMTARGYKFEQIDINRSDALNFIVNEEKNGLIIPFVALDSLGDVVASSVVEARNKASFTSIKDVSRRSKLSNTLIEKLKRIGAFKDLPEDDEIGLFKFL